MNDKILLEETRLTTRFTAFATNIDEDSSTFKSGVDAGMVPAYLTFGLNGVAQDIVKFSGGTVFYRTARNTFIPIDDTDIDYVTGYTWSTSLPSQLPPANKDNPGIGDKYFNKFHKVADFLSSGRSQTHVVREEVPVTDYIVNVGIESSFDALDTLNVYNSLENGIPSQESDTGVVFGRLIANQKIKDRNGNVIKIPLSNVPIGIFQPSEEFPTAVSTDENGNRIQLNFLNNESESPVNFDYQITRRGESVINPDSQSEITSRSADLDLKFILNSDSLESIPEHYKIISKTNENGEFVLYEAPVGTQILFFEVDLLKQGMTKEEVGLNFFPYPTISSPNIDSVPHFFFRQFPIDVLPSWGNLQTGYTETNINVNLDLRKWATYYFPPISVSGQDLAELQGPPEPQAAKIEIDIRDMTSPNFDVTPVSLVEIADPIDRILTQQLQWQNEIIQSKSTAEFKRDDFSILKLPANIYDPNSFSTSERFKTDISENENFTYNPSKGAWFAGYQFKMRNNVQSTWFRTTGFERDNSVVSTSRSRDHFHINRGETTQTPNESKNNSRIGFFPYERPWDALYPDKVKIPSPPKDRNPNWRGANDDVNRYVPKYVDGDLVGNPSNDTETGGWGLQLKTDVNPSRAFANTFAKRVTKNYLYKYEGANHSRSSVYSNGYSSRRDTNTTSIVLEGENYQRVECGAGYFMRVEGWPDVIQRLTTDQIREDFTHGNTALVDGVDLQEDLDLTIKSGPDAAKQEGSIEIFRILNPDPDNVLDPEPQITPSSVIINTDRIYRRRDNDNNRMRLGYAENNKNGSGISTYFYPHIPSSRGFLFTSFALEIRNTGTKTVENPFIPGVDLKPQESASKTVILDSNTVDGAVSFFFSNISGKNRLSNIQLKLEGNDDFDPSNFSYKKCRYRLAFKEFSNQGPQSNFSTNSHSVNIDVDSSIDDPLNYYLNQTIDGAQTNINGGKNRSCTEFWNKDHDVTIRGIVMGAGSGKENNGSLFLSSERLSFDCNQDKTIKGGGAINLAENLKLIGWKFK